LSNAVCLSAFVRCCFVLSHTHTHTHVTHTLHAWVVVPWIQTASSSSIFLFLRHMMFSFFSQNEGWKKKERAELDGVLSFDERHVGYIFSEFSFFLAMKCIG
jgi:hypothetical protein